MHEFLSRGCLFSQRNRWSCALPDTLLDVSWDYLPLSQYQTKRDTFNPTYTVHQSKVSNTINLLSTWKKKTCYVEKHGFDSLQHINQLFQGQDVPYVQTPVLNAFSPFYRVRDKSEWVSEEVRTPDCNHNNLLNIVRYELSDTCMLNLYVLFLWA